MQKIIELNNHNQFENRLTNSFVFLIILFPLGTLVIKGWVSGFLFAISLISIVLLVKAPNKTITTSSVNNSKELCPKFWVRLFTIMFCTPICAVLFSQILRDQFYAPDFDSVSRFLIALPIFYALIGYKLSVLKNLQYAIGIGLIITFLVMPWIPKFYGVDHPLYLERQATYFIDPLTFGRLCLTFGFMMLFTINLYKKDQWYEIIFKLICTALGVYLSFRSGSRTGWLVLPFVFLFLAYLNFPKSKLKATAFTLIFGLVFIITSYSTSTKVQQHINDAMSNIENYHWNSPNPETSLGERISFARMGLYYFKLNPLEGFGHDGYKSHHDDPELQVFAIEATRHAPAEGANFHNEFITNMVAYGLGGIIYTCLLFFAPLALFLYSWTKKLQPKLSALGIIYVLSEFLSSLSYEVFAYKFTASLYAIMVTILIAEMLIKHQEEKALI
jgi:O-antigen ligase